MRRSASRVAVCWLDAGGHPYIADYSAFSGWCSGDQTLALCASS